MNTIEITKKTLPLTKNQTALWLDQVMSEDKALYVIGGCAEIKANLDITAFQKALQKIIGEMDTMGISIHVEDGIPFQVINPQLNYKLPFIDFSTKPNAEETCQNWIKEQLEIPFVLDQAPLYEFALVKAGTRHYFWMMKVHHLIMDGWGGALFVDKLDKYYHHYATGAPSPNGQQPPLFQEYIPQEQAYQNSEAHTIDRAYWVQKFQQLPSSLVEKRIGVTPKLLNKEKTWLIPEQLQSSLEVMAKARNVSLAQLWSGILATYFYKITQKEDLCFGLPITNRDTKSEKNTIGLFTGVVPLSLQVSADLTFVELLAQIKKTRRSDRPHQRFSLGELMNELRHLHNSAQPVYDISINFDNIICELKGLDSEFIWWKRGGERKTPMTFFIKPYKENNKWELKLAFLPTYCSESAAEMLLLRLEALINNLLQNPKQSLQTVNLLPKAEQQLLLKDFNSTQADYPTDKTIVDLFEEQVAKTPNNIAVTYEGKSLSYEALNEKANNIAQYLISEYKIQPDDIIGLQVARSEWLLVGILGILKTGAAYLPMGPDMPQARVAFMLEDSAAKLLLTDKNSYAIAKEFENIAPVLTLEQLATTTVNCPRPTAYYKPSNLAYIIYTSGSTGKPKGVMIEHRNVVRLMVNDQSLFDFNEKDVWTLFHYYGFDFSVWEIWGALLFGGRVVVVPKQTTLNPEAFADLLLEEKVTVLNQVPSTFDQVQVHLLKKAKDNIDIRYIIFGGTKLIPSTLRAWKMRFPATRLINMYGITETTVHVTYKEISGTEIEAGISNIGEPIPTLRCYILDAALQPVPIGSVGEIYVAGAGLARGYLNNPTLTAERFINNPFEKGAKLYKSGDSGRWLENGDIEFFGRIDFQLKIRGFRIEAGEIEQLLLAHPAIQSTIVLGKEIKETTELVAYITRNNSEEMPSLDSLRTYLGEDLPAYMVPAYFVQMDAFPLTKNGKIDRKALPEPDGLSLTSGMEFIAPRNATEEKLVAAFGDILGIDPTAISVQDDFFNLGGDSIKLIRLVGRINREVGVKLPLAKVYMASQVVELADYILENTQHLATAASKYTQLKIEIEAQIAVLKESFLTQQADANIEAIFPMSDIQKGMVFGNLLYEKEGVYHDQAVYAIGHIGFEKARFEKAVQLMVDKHPTLRTAFRLDYEGEDIQLVYKTIKLPLSYQETENLRQDELELMLTSFLREEIQKGFAIEKPGLWRMRIFQADSKQPLLVLQFHHAIFDGWSLASFNTELLKIYHQLAANPAYQPTATNLSYQDFVIRELITKKDETIRDFWQNELGDYERVDLFTEEILDDEFEINIGSQYLKRIETLAEHYGVPVKILTLSSYLILLDFLSYQSESVIGIISTNRLPEEEGDQLLGCFLNSVPLRVPVDRQASATTFIQQVAEKIKSLRGKDQLTTMEIARLLGENATQGNPIFDVIFNYIDFHIYEDLDAIGMGATRMMSADLNSIPTFFERTNTYFDLMVNTTGDELTLKIQLSKKLKTGYTAQEVLYKYIGILDSLEAAPNTTIGAIDFLNEKEQNLLLHKFNDTEVVHDTEKTVVHLFEEQAAKTPHRTALVFDETAITYEELEKRSRQLAIYLQQQGVQTDTLVGLCMNRSIEMMVAILGILRAGGAYVPLDPGYPKDRVVYMLEDGIIKGNKEGDAKIILTQEELKPLVTDNIDALDITLIALSDNWGANEPIAMIEGTLTNKPSPEDLVYVIFTSGSTGKPKGTLVKHQGFYNLMRWYIDDFDFHADSKFLLVSSINFDLTQKNLYAPLVLGGSLHISSAENYDLTTITSIIKGHRITNINCTPSIFYGFVEEAASKQFDVLQSLEYVFLGGEPINLLKLDKWYNSPYNKAKLVNSYGPTECSDVVSHYEIESTKITTIPIGKPICNTQLYVLDKYQKLVPLGVQGELGIGGKGIGRGYLNNPTLTNEKFIANPFKEGDLLYKTGDLARMLPDGNIEFLGRADHQLKIRGYRVETGEIEAILQKHTAIHSTIVVGKQIGDSKELIAYLVPSADKLPALEKLRSYLSEELPDYMVPTYFVELAALPLTPSGKVNRLALPEPTANSLASSVNFVAPRTRTEAILVRIWEKVLQTTEISIHDNFFNLGGHSLRAIRLVSFIQQELSIAIKLSEIFTYPTIATLATQLAGKSEKNLAAIEPIDIQEHYALSNAQRRLWLVDQMEEGQTVYNMPMVLRLKGKLNLKALRIAIEKLVDRHENLRTNIITIEGQPRQLIHEVGQFDLRITPWNGNRKEDLSEYILNFAQRPYDLVKDVLFRLELVQLDSKEQLLLFNMHHILFDGWSTQILLKELGYLYETHIHETASLLPALSIQYKDYAAWQSNLLKEGELMEDLRNYWLQKLAPSEEGIPVLELPADYARPAIQTYNGSIITKTLAPKVLKGLEKLSQSAGATLFMSLTALVKVLLYRYSKQRDILVGTPAAGRVHPDLDNQLGFYVNMLVLRDYVGEGMSFMDFLKGVKQTNLEAIEHEFYPYDHLVEDLDLVRDRSRSPLFDVMVIFQNADPSALNFDQVKVNLETVDWQTSKYDLSFGFSTDNKGLTIDIEYNTNIYKADRVHRMFDHLECLIESVLADAQQSIEQLAILPATERQLIVQDFATAQSNYDFDKTIHQLFEEQVVKTPNKIAVVFEGKELSFRVVNEKANQVAHYLKTKHNIQPDDIIALQVERSEWMVIALLGIMKAGGAYLPLATDYPTSRTAFMLQDSAARLLLTDAITTEAAQTAFKDSLPVVAVEKAQHSNKENPKNSSTCHNLAYIIYTSGSTGQPKGVLLEHRGVANMLLSQIEDLAVTAKDNTLLFAPYTFDASVPELFMGLCMGAKLVIANRKSLLSVEVFKDLMHQHQITLADIPPTYLAVLDEAALEKVRLLITAGEAAISKDVQKYSSQLQYVNIYGPTENSVVSSSFKIPATYEIGQSVPIGRPIANSSTLILDEQLQLVPIGVAGEIVLGGVGLARGYLNNPSLTKSKFIPHPFETGERLYRTGDLGRWLADGNIEFLGRIDHQLKIRGHRIEAGEIEDRLLQHPTIQSAVVIGKTINGTKDLVAYLVAKENKSLSVADLRNYLGEGLPDYMIPAYFVELEALPLTSHDKVNRKALPTPDVSNTLTSTDYTAPKSEMEILLVKTWEEVLRRPQIGIHDNFFHIGGDSIKALQISGRLGAQGYALPIKELFLQPTIAQLAFSVTTKKQHYPQGIVNGTIPLTAIQEWFFDQIDSKNQHQFNQAFFLSGKEQLNAILVQKSLKALLIQHDILRATYFAQDGLFKQDIEQVAFLDFQQVVIPEEADEAYLLAQYAAKAQTSFDLAKGPLLKAILFKKVTGDELLLVIHHLVVDGVSWRILLEDLNMAYEQLAAGKPISLAPKTAPFAWWSEKIKDYANSPKGLTNKNYWEQLLSKPVDSLIIDSPNQSNKVGDSAVVQLQLTKQQTQTLLQQTNQAYNTEINDVLLSALSRALYQTFGGTAYQITLEGHGREELFDMDVSRTVGWFTSMFPIVLAYEQDFGQHLQLIKEHLHRVPNKGMDYALLHYLNKTAFSEEAKSAVSFNYLGAFSDGEQADLLNFSNREVGESISPNMERDAELDVLGMLLEGQLQLSISYGKQRMDSAKMDTLAKNFKQALIQLIKHCTTQKTSQLSPIDFTACHLSLEQYQSFLTANQLSATAIEDIYTLSPLQEGMLFHKLMTPDSPAYFNQVELFIATPIDIPHFKNCWEQIVKAHPALRTSFFSEGLPSPLQVVNKTVDLDFVHHDIVNKTLEEQEQLIQNYILADRKKGFELSQKSLLRLALFQTDIAQFRLVVSDHHITMDGWSQAILLQDLKRLYRKEIRSIKVKPYSPYIAWLNEQSANESEAFWKDYLAGYEETVAIPKLKTTTSTLDMDAQVELLQLSKAQTNALEQLAKDKQVSLNTVIQGIWAVILGIYNQKEEVVFGITTSGRSAPIKDIEQLSGLFINTIPLRVAWSKEDSFTDLLSNIQQSALNIQEYEHSSLALIQNLWEGEGDLIDHTIAFENYPSEDPRAAAEGNLNITNTNGYEPVHYDFGLVVGQGESLQIYLNYNKAVVDTDWIKRIKNHIATAINTLLEQPQQLVGEIDIIPLPEKNLLLNVFNDTMADFPADKTIIDLFEAQVAKTPDNIAVIFEDIQLTYGELNEKANRLAYTLRESVYIQPDDIIALQLERSEWMIISIFGILKAGAAYLPIATDFPASRVEYMLQDSQAKALLSDKQSYSIAKEMESRLPVIAVESLVTTTKVPIDFQSSPINAHNLAYIIYTSGSTGQPKGVMIEHQGIVNRLNWMQNAYPIGQGDCILQKTPYTFDVSVWEVLWWSLQGATVVMLEPKSEKEPAKIIETIAKYQVSTMHFVPSMLNAFLAYVHQFPIQQETQSLRQVFASGEALGMEQIHQFNQLIGNKQTLLHNLYGPTEASIDVSYFDCRELGNKSMVPIGKPIENIELHIINKNRELVPLGITGELCISGVGLARGYVNNPILTAEKFIPHPFKEGERLYKTGDLARWLPDGNIEFLGRIDHQLKIRGYRIEAGEIEQALLAYPTVESVVVIGYKKKKEESQELVAYLTAQEGAELPDIATFHQFLGKRLPDYMIPAYFIALEQMPLNASGKINRKALPPLEEQAFLSNTAYLAPSNETEEILVTIWQEILAIDKISIHDNFFHLGGHSLKAIRLLGQVQEKLALQFPLQLLFQYPVLADQAQQLILLKEYKDSYTHQLGIRLNPRAKQTVFTFPPFFGLSIWYKQLANQLPDTSFYCFDFLLNDNRLDLYYEQIKKEQATGPYLLFGYSAGGSLAYEMAAFMEAKGEEIAGVIMGDSMIVSAMKTDLDQYLQDLSVALSTREDETAKGLLELINHTILRKQSLQRITAYQTFLNNCKNHSIQAAIHLIKAKFEAEIADMHQRWNEYTNGNYAIHQASGSHDYLFELPNLEGNAAMLQAIFEQSTIAANVID